nr:AraC family transcriptional regulator [Aequitasia blattaphilus]
MESALSLRDLREYFEFFTNYILKELELLRQTTQSKYAQPVNQAIDYIESNYRNSVKLDDVSKILDLNPAYLSSLFKKETGINFLDYLHDYRLEKAKTLLKDSNYNISEISDLVGYNDSRHFSKLFKKKFGINPSDYKQMYN